MIPGAAQIMRPRLGKVSGFIPGPNYNNSGLDSGDPETELEIEKEVHGMQDTGNMITVDASHPGGPSQRGDGGFMCRDCILSNKKSNDSTSEVLKAHRLAGVPATRAPCASVCCF